MKKLHRNDGIKKKEGNEEELKMKKWYSLTCPVCGFRFLEQKFNKQMNPILYPLQIVTGGGRAKGFTVDKYIPWSALPDLKQTNTWNSLLSLYNRLATAYDHFYEVLGFLSPEIMRLIRTLKGSYSDIYLDSNLIDYAPNYPTLSTSDTIVAYRDPDYSEAYAHLFSNLPLGGLRNE